MKRLVIVVVLITTHVGFAMAANQLTIEGDRFLMNGKPFEMWGVRVASGSQTEEFRFTSKDDVLYATALAWPVDGLFTIESLARKNPYDSRKIKSVDFVSSSGSVKWKQTNKGLVIQAKSGKPCGAAYVFRIQFQR